MSDVFERLVQSLKEATEGDLARATFVGVDMGKGRGFSGVMCPRCGAAHHWRKREPKWCRDCGLPFRFVPSP